MNLRKVLPGANLNTFHRYCFCVMEYKKRWLEGNKKEYTLALEDFAFLLHEYVRTHKHK